MKYFLERIASHLLDTCGEQLDKQCLVFPNRRAGLYFLKYLSGKAGKPVWAPAVRTINELFVSSSRLGVAETETLIFELYRVYRELNPKAESFDEFYFWGDMIINDFDDADKYMVDAGKLFTNLSDLRKIDTAFGTLTDEQIEVIKQFWVNFNAGGKSKEKEDFLGIWTLLPGLYTDFRNSLRCRGIAYEGMIFRDIAEMCISGSVPEMKWETLHFIGFNALNRCEKTLLHALRKNGRARFYWDYDISYTESSYNHTAGFFLRSNISEFGNDMPGGWNYKSEAFAREDARSWKIISTPSDIAQVKLVPSFLEELKEKDEEDAHHTAIILSDENLLVPLLSSLPETVGGVNVTMGYPLKLSPVYSLVKLLLMLQQNARAEGDAVLFNRDDVTNILKHSYFSDEEKYGSKELNDEIVSSQPAWIREDFFKGSELFEMLFKRVNSPAGLPSYLRDILGILFIPEENSPEAGTDLSTPEINIHNEFIYRTLLVINRLEKVIPESEIRLSSATWYGLFDRILRRVSIPFTGEPLQGIQVMGILETRALDFRNLIILSVNEGILPRSSAGSSYIPFSLREAFGLPVIKHQDSIYAYYFYRLLQRAENVRFVYNSSSEGLRTGEMSRFLLQLLLLGSNPPESASSSFEIAARPSFPSSVKRNSRHVRILEESYLSAGGKLLSPRAVNTWLSCTMRFFYRYVCGLQEPERVVTEIDPLLFGEILHSVMQTIYGPWIGKKLDASRIESIHDDHAQIKGTIKGVLQKKFTGSGSPEKSGMAQVASEILFSYIRLILRRDMMTAPFEIAGLEEKMYTDLAVKYNSGKINLKTGGIIDRYEKMNDSVRIIDYKTGSVSMEIKSISSLFDPDDEKRNESWFQVMIYCEVIHRNSSENTRIIPGIYAVRSLPEPGFSERLVIGHGRDSREPLDNYSNVRDEFVRGLSETLEAIFSRNSAFTMTEHNRKCEYCSYRKLCRR
jgi:hypothetical protein